MLGPDYRGLSSDKDYDIKSLIDTLSLRRILKLTLTRIF